MYYVDGLAQDCGHSSVLPMELQPRAKPSTSCVLLISSKGKYTCMYVYRCVPIPMCVCVYEWVSILVSWQ